ncbi:MAG: response regulator transcription factor [Bacilli bacterium]|nr:response regulator transcription factor [Bacilli bacterium]
MRFILIADDEQGIREVIKEYCFSEGYQVLEAKDGIEVLEILKNHSVDFIILDIMMPNLDGFSTYQEIKNTKNIPTLILSARGEEYDKLLGFELGIDDYLTKPFSPKELMARIKAILKRANHEVEVFQYQTLHIDFKGYTIEIDKKEVKVTPKEFEILTYLIKNQNIAISRDQLLSKIWGYDFFGDDRTVDTHIKMLRNNLGKYRDLILTVRGLGYKFEVPKENEE